MDYVKLGPTGLDVSRLILGCMTFGDPGRGTHPWTLNEEASRPVIKHALEAGINFFDTANTYSNGSSEEILGRALADYARRDDIVISTKVFQGMRQGPNAAGLSRKAIFQELDASLQRLGTDYIDLYQIHRWDPNTPIEETLEALHDAVKAGKVRYLGASSMWAWQFSKAQYTARANNWTPFISMQNQYNLLNREEEREMLPLCHDLGVGVIPWSPMARGRLTRKWDESTDRQETDDVAKALYLNDDGGIVDSVSRVAEARGVPMAQVALAWVAQRPGITAPIIGAKNERHIVDAVAALQIDLEPTELASLEACYSPRPAVGF